MLTKILGRLARPLRVAEEVEPGLHGQAAGLLGVSRPYLVRLLEEGKIPFRKVGTHRRVRAVDAMQFKAKRRGETRQLLDELTRGAQELGMGYRRRWRSRSSTTPAFRTRLRCAPPHAAR